MSSTTDVGLKIAVPQRCTHNQFIRSSWKAFLLAKGNSLFLEKGGCNSPQHKECSKEHCAARAGGDDVRVKMWYRITVCVAHVSVGGYP